MNKNKKRVAVVGAGPAGLTAAYKLVKAGVAIDIYEADQSVGGMAKTISLWGQFVDLGPHRFFSSDPRVNRLWLKLVGSDYSMVNRITRIYYKKTFFDYPLKALNVLRGLGMLESIRCVVSYFFSKFVPAQEKKKTFESWVINRFGKRLFEIFFKSYSEKLWGISCKELDADFAAQRIKKLSFFEAVKSSLTGVSNSKHKTLVDEFAYPHYGAGLVYERMAKEITENNGQLRLKTFVKSVASGYGTLKPQVELATGEIIKYDHIISTMPITLLVQQMKAPIEVINHAKALKFRNTILVYLLVEDDETFPDQWIYVHSTKLTMGRITNFRNWVPSINCNKTDTILCLEYWCYDFEDIWVETDKNLIALATKEIYQTKLVANGKVKNGSVVRISKCYPVYSLGYKEHLRPIEKFLSQQQGISVIGRYGAFKYNNQDHSILMGLLAAENILQKAGHNLWELNTDYEYQESSKITATGLIVNE